MPLVDNFSTRRTFIKTFCAATAVGGLGLDSRLSHSACQRPMRVRHDINDVNFGAPAAEAYREAVGKLKALPSSDPRNWSQLANIHRDFCPHGNWYFLPWHRAYLLAFEDICAEAMG